MSPNTFMPEKSEEDGKSLLSGSAVADPAQNGYEVDEEAQLYDKNLKNADKDYKLFTLRPHSVINFHDIINFQNATTSDQQP
jgi:hypothetical protein